MNATAHRTGLHWSAEFVGIPCKDLGRDRMGCDCWGLVWLVGQARGVPYPSYDGRYLSADEKQEIAAVIAGEAGSPLWKRIEGTPQELDIAIFREGRFDHHAGIILWPGTMLHMARGDAAKLERYDSGRWALRLTGIYRFSRAQTRTPVAT